ncbi:trigger factor-like protein TIG, Chloroplastic isoform X3 [Dendrobium catenatum]|uniref:trigger factor-like protein TIG, Chloroplastic isoform X3 n=1 Tax=Dendrobium catenatum TaxID=906689 RepID=UPI00109F1389|nr:trigger factor-like protein TIG, Chloroplastic isoform X3 [Dendrobium catenatum]
MALLVGVATHLRPRCPKTDFPSSSTLKDLCSSQSHLSPYLPSRRLLPCLFYSSTRHPRLVTVSAAAISVEKTEKDRFPVTVTETKQPRSSVRLCIEVPPNSCKESYNKVLREFSNQAKVPGFRPGKKIPENILINYVGLHNIQQAVIEAILKKTLPQAMISVEGRALKDSVRIVTKFAEMYDSFSPEDYFRYDVLVDVVPEIKWLAEAKYKNLKIIVQIDKTITAEIASEIEFKRRYKAQGSLRIVTDRGLQMGDLVVLDILAARIEGDLSIGEKIPSAERKGFHLDTEESDNLLPGFLNSILGIRQGETKSFSLQFPESWEQVNLCGVQAQFTVECKELFYRDLPKLDDSLAEKLFPGCSSLSQVRESILQRCREVEQTAIEQATDNAILEQLSKIVEVDIPQSLFEEQGRQLYGARLLQLQAGRKVNEQQLSSLSSEKAVNEYLENQKENITSIIKQMLAVGEIFQCENLEEQYETKF